MLIGMMTPILVKSTLLAIVLSSSGFPDTSIDSETGPPPDGAEGFQLPCEYPLQHEDSVVIRPVIKQSAYDLTPSTTKWSYPIFFDLRNVDGHNYVTPVKSQSGGTCWTHGTMASLESNILMSGRPWIAYLPEQNYPCMDEYHLDWWNGFNEHHNADITPPTGEGLVVHNGGDYLVAAAYFARNDGAVDRYLTTGTLYLGSYASPALQHCPDYDYYFPREIEWLTAGTELENIDAIKEALQTTGAVATAICWSGAFYSSTQRTFYQPPSSDLLPNHSVTIAGWDDTLTTQAPQPGAWLCKNSWGASWGLNGYFWISYYDKVAGKHPEMGAVVFHDFEIVDYRTVYGHDYHGWRDTKEGCQQALNAYTVLDERMLSQASFISAADNVSYTLEIYDDFDELGGPTSLLASAEGIHDHLGLHTVTLDRNLKLPVGDDFFVSLQLSDGGMAFDRTSQIPVLLGGATADALVRSKSAADQSYYWESSAWHDLYEDDTTANFCMKALADKLSPVGVSESIGAIPFAVTFSATWPDAEVLGYQWDYDDGAGSSEPTPTHTFEEPGLHSVTLSLTTSEGIVDFLHKNAIAVHADTLTITEGIADEGGAATVDVLLHNELPLEMMLIPFTWEGPLQVNFDSMSIAGSRLDGIGYSDVLTAVPALRAATVYWYGDQTTFLDPGDGPVASLYFTADGGSPGDVTPIKIEEHSSILPQLFCAGLADYVPELVDGQIASHGCCFGRVGNANGQGVYPDEITLGDIMLLVDAVFISYNCDKIPCLLEADVNQDGSTEPNCDDHITLGDIMMLVDFLFITGPETAVLHDCL
jgi:C1A family cysteine protease